jgi:hypothetical protein
MVGKTPTISTLHLRGTSRSLDRASRTPSDQVSGVNNSYFTYRNSRCQPVMHEGEYATGWWRSAGDTKRRHRNVERFHSALRRRPTIELEF